MNGQWIAKCLMAMIFIFTAASAQAQFEQPPQQPGEAPDISDEELKVFVDASMKAQQIQTESQMEMIAIVEGKDLEVETYNQIMQGMQMGQAPDEMEVSSDELARFEEASELIAEIEQEMETELIAAIEDEGMNLERYQEVFAAVQQNPELQQKLQQMIQEVQMQQGQQQPQGY